LDAGAARSLHPVAAQACLQPSPAQRGRVALQAIQALREGRLSARELTHALGQGDGGIAAMLHRRGTVWQRPVLSPETICLKAFEQAPGEHVREPLAELMRVLAADGDLTADDCRAITDPAGTFGILVRRINNAWNRRCERLTAPIRALLPPDVHLHPSYLVMPGALLAALQPGVFTHPPYDSRRNGDEPPDVQVCATGRLIVPDPSSHEDPEARAALHAAWNALAQAIDSPFMESADNGLSSLVGYADELLNDAALGCEWNGDDAVISDGVLQELSDEIGIDGSDPEMRDGMRAFLRFSRKAAKAPRLAHRSAAMRAWCAKSSESPIGRTVTILLALAKLATRGPRVNREAVQRDYSDEGLLPVCLLPQGTGLDGYFDYCIDQNFQHCGEAEVALTRSEDSGVPLGQLMDRTILDAALVAAAASVVAAHQEANQPRGDDEPLSDFGDDDDE
jgi:hypothetical protein